VLSSRAPRATFEALSAVLLRRIRTQPLAALVTLSKLTSTISASALPRSATCGNFGSTGSRSIAPSSARSANPTRAPPSSAPSRASAQCSAWRPRPRGWKPPRNSNSSTSPAAPAVRGYYFGHPRPATDVASVIERLNDIRRVA